MPWLVLGLVLVGLIIGLTLTSRLIGVGARVGAMDSAGSDGHVKTLRAVPNIGGIAIYAAVAGPLAFGLVLLHAIRVDLLARWVPALVEHLDRIRESTPTAVAVLAGMTVLHVTGLVDDRRSLSPWVKLGVQVAVSAVIVIGFDVRLLTLLGPGPSIVVTIGWIVVMTNAVNFLDNMDGLAGGVAAIAGAMLMVATIVNHQWFIAGTLALLVGGLAGFLVFNFPPARIFMGDGGSLMIGFLLAVLTARTTFYQPDGSALGAAWYGVFMPLVILAVPLYDFVSVTAIRLSQRRSPFVGDQQHLSHRLVRRRLSERDAVLAIWGLTAVTGIGGVSLGHLAPWQAALVGVQTLVVLGLVALLEHASRHAAGGPPEPPEPPA